jgi:hypothetical protein
MATTAQITAKCAEIAQQMRAQTEVMRRLAAASARLAVNQPTSARSGAMAQPEQRMGEVTGPAATPDAEMSTADLLRAHGCATVAARGWLPGEQRREQ